MTLGLPTWGLKGMPCLPQNTAQTHKDLLQGQLNLDSFSQLDSGLPTRFLEFHLPGIHRSFKWGLRLRSRFRLAMGRPWNSREVSPVQA